MATSSPARSNETLFAVLGAAVLSVIVASLLVGNPVTAVRAAFTDVVRTGPAGPDHGAPPAAAAKP